ncbi:MAG: glutathione synthase [SAR86 cluster bacterium]|jgi:glutathione synthase|nr:glutathione synthase [SAR86 cluster bacterium]
MKIGIVMDPLALINFSKDSTFAMMLEMQIRGYEFHYISPNSLTLEPDSSFAITSKVQVDLKSDIEFILSDEEKRNLSYFDIILMRQDPPFNMDYIYSTYVLDKAEEDGVLVVNKPSSLRNYNEKVFTTLFPECSTPFLVSSNYSELKSFIEEFEDIIIKPLDGMGGSSVYRLKVDDHNISVILEDMTNNFSRKIMAQTYIPEILDGDKRILIIDGIAMDAAIARVPAEGELRGNLAAGGTAIARPLSDRDKWICDQVGPELKKLGLVFVGVDIIGDYLTEINVTSPTCIQEYQKLCGIDVASIFIDCLEKNEF